MRPTCFWKLREGALVAEAEARGDFADLRTLLLQRFTRGLDAQLDDERLRTAAEGLDELPVESARRDVEHVGEFLHHMLSRKCSRM